LLEIKGQKPEIKPPKRRKAGVVARLSEDEMKKIISDWLDSQHIKYIKEYSIGKTRQDFFIKAGKRLVIEVKSCIGRPSGCQGFITGLGEAIYASFFVDEVWYVVPENVADYLNEIKREMPERIKIVPISCFLR